MSPTNAGTEASLYIGRVLNSRWQIIGVINDGGFGYVFSANDVTTKEIVAVKILKLQHVSLAHTVQEFQDEARYLRLLETCSKVVNILDSGADQQIVKAPNGAEIPINAYFIVLEIADLALTDFLVYDASVFAWPERLQVLRDVVLGTHQMHRKSVVNRDLKSENVLLFSAPKNQIVAKIADLGRARNLHEPARLSPDQYALPRGDFRFAAPELIWLLGQENSLSMRAADLYHIGSILFELATGIGLTSYVVPDPLPTIQANQRASEAARAERFAVAKPDLRDQYLLAYETFAQSVPPTIQTNLTALLKQLTELDPEARFPRVRGRYNHGESLDWLLRKVDVVILQLKKAEINARRLEKRKVAA